MAVLIGKAKVMSRLSRSDGAPAETLPMGI
jgi:hypothetical protein